MNNISKRFVPFDFPYFSATLNCRCIRIWNNKNRKYNISQCPVYGGKRTETRTGTPVFWIILVSFLFLLKYTLNKAFFKLHFTCTLYSIYICINTSRLSHCIVKQTVLYLWGIDTHLVCVRIQNNTQTRVKDSILKSFNFFFHLIRVITYTEETKKYNFSMFWKPIAAKMYFMRNRVKSNVL